tara:strand:+ start:2612 stop:3406 length:795 start_codon:yes stop_codon:yes gene_type:complete
MSLGKTPLISIIMNCHNGEKYLRQSLKSILTQSYKNWELIFWDNCSTDNSRKILNYFKDKRIIYYKSKQFLNLYHARKIAVNKAHGKYICFLDVDDYWSKEKLKKQINFFLKNDDYKILYTNYYIKYQNKNKKKIKYKNKILPEGNITQKLLDDYVIGILTVMMDKKIFKLFKFQKKYNIIGDFDLMIKSSINFKIGCLQQPLAYYRIHDSNYSNNKIKLYIEELKFWIKENKKFLIKNSLCLSNIKKLILKLQTKRVIKYLGV